MVLTSPWTTCSTCHLDLLPQSRVPEASGAGGERKACFPTGAHAPGVCHHCCRRIPRDHARKRAQGTTVLTAFDNPIPLSLQYVKGGGGASYFPVSAITDRLDARNQLITTTLRAHRVVCRRRSGGAMSPVTVMTVGAGARAPWTGLGRGGSPPR